jgi:hypothetical protein
VSLNLPKPEDIGEHYLPRDVSFSNVDDVFMFVAPGKEYELRHWVVGQLRQISIDAVSVTINFCSADSDSGHLEEFVFDPEHVLWRIENADIAQLIGWLT